MIESVPVPKDSPNMMRLQNSYVAHIKGKIPATKTKKSLFFRRSETLLLFATAAAASESAIDDPVAIVVATVVVLAVISKGIDDSSTIDGSSGTSMRMLLDFDFDMDVNGILRLVDLGVDLVVVLVVGNAERNDNASRGCNASRRPTATTTTVHNGCRL